MKLFSRGSDQKKEPVSNLEEYESKIKSELFSPKHSRKRLEKIVSGIEEGYGGSLLTGLNDFKEQANLVTDSSVSLEENEIVSLSIEDLAILLIFALLEVVIPDAMDTDESSKILYGSAVSTSRYHLSDLYKSNQLIRMLIDDVVEEIRNRKYSQPNNEYIDNALKIITS